LVAGNPQHHKDLSYHRNHYRDAGGRQNARTVYTIGTSDRLRDNGGVFHATQTIYKILPGRLWTEAVEAGVFDGSPLDIADGFIHFSTAAQVRETAAKHFDGQAELVLVAVSAEALGDRLKWEPSRGGDLFPHLYAPLTTDRALWVRPLPLGPDGRHKFPDDVAG